jgi:bifunctional non-homologous end joining protein LigD
MDPPTHQRKAMPEHLRPMLAKTGRLPADDEGWAFEVKWDGVRAITYWRPGRMRFESRNLKDVSSRYPEVRELRRQLGMREAVLDGEIVAFDEHGAPSFARLQHRMHLTSEHAIRRRSREAPVTYVIFDLLYLDDHLLTALPYRERRSLLERLELQGPAWQTPAYHVGEGADFLAVTAEHGLEGALAKRIDSPYRPGERGGEWLKIKNVGRQELVIGGWLPGKGRRTGQIGALLMGYYEQEGDARRELRYAGRVGTGFDEPELLRLAAELNARRRSDSPFGERGVKPPRNARFIEPELVAEIEFSHWTRERILRHSSYKGLRLDKPAEEVEMEMEGSTVPAPVTTASRPTTPRRERRGRGRSTVQAPSTKAFRPIPGRGQQAQAFRPTPGRGQQAQKTSTMSALGAARSQAEAPYEVLRETKRHTEIEVEGRTLRLSNREKVLYPRTGFTKGQMVDYYAALGPVLLGHLAERPLTLKRYPNGVEGQYFYEKRCPSHRPEWVRTAPIWTERVKAEIDYCVVDDLPTLIWAANLASIELHPSLSHARDMDTPSAMVFDLDPGAPPERPDTGLRACCRVALWIRELLDAFGLRSLVKTSGSKGLQVYVPLNTPVSYAQTKPFARAVAELLEKTHPRQVVSRMAKQLRAGKVLIDWSQNDARKTTVCAYSLRAREHPTISTPLAWEEVEQALSSRRAPNLSAEPTALLERVSSHGDLFQPLLDLLQELPDLAAAAPAEFESTVEKGSSTSPVIHSDKGGSAMPPRGVKKGSKRDRQYKHVKQSEQEQGASERRAEEIAARTVNKERARSGESRTRSRSSTKDISSGRRGGLRSGKSGPRGRTREQLYQEARKLGIEGRSRMNKAQLQRAVDAKKR